MKNVPCPGIVVNHAEICPRGRRLSLFLSLSLFKKRERDRERPVVVERCHALPPPPTCKGRLVRVFNVVLDRAKNVRAIRKLHTWMRGDSRCSIYVTCNWPGGRGKTPLSYGTADRIRRRCDYNFEENEGKKRLWKLFFLRKPLENSFSIFLRPTFRIKVGDKRAIKEALSFNIFFFTCIRRMISLDRIFLYDSIHGCMYPVVAFLDTVNENCSFDSWRSCCRCCCACSGLWKEGRMLF